MSKIAAGFGLTAAISLSGGLLALEMVELNAGPRPLRGGSFYDHA